METEDTTPACLPAPCRQDVLGPGSVICKLVPFINTLKNVAHVLFEQGHTSVDEASGLLLLRPAHSPANTLLEEAYFELCYGLRECYKHRAVGTVLSVSTTGGVTLRLV